MLRVNATLKGIDGDAIIDYWMNPPAEKLSMIKESRTIETLADGAIISY